MADRQFHDMTCQGTRHVTYNVAITLASGAPVFAQGDKIASASGAYLTLADTDTGVITVTTVDPFLAVVSCQATRSMATPTGNAIVTLGLPTQDSTTKKWSVTINTWTNSAGTHSAADIEDDDLVNFTIVLRNSDLKP